MDEKYKTSIASSAIDVFGSGRYEITVEGPVPDDVVGYDGRETVIVDVEAYGDGFTTRTKFVNRDRGKVWVTVGGEPQCFGPVRPNKSRYYKAARAAAIRAYNAKFAAKKLTELRRVSDRGYSVGTRIASTSIIRRVDPCGCGCTGKDPWHARKFVRTITDIREESGTASSYAESFSLDYDLVGLTSAPWSDEKVVVVRWRRRDDSGYPLGWIFAKNLLVEKSDKS